MATHVEYDDSNTNVIDVPISLPPIKENTGSSPTFPTPGELVKPSASDFTSSSQSSSPDAANLFISQTPPSDLTIDLHIANRPSRPRKLSAAQVVELTSQPLSPTLISEETKENVEILRPTIAASNSFAVLDLDHESSDDIRFKSDSSSTTRPESKKERFLKQLSNQPEMRPPYSSGRTFSTPPVVRRKKSISRGSDHQSRSKSKNLDNLSFKNPAPLATPPPDDLRTPATAALPVPTLSLPTYLQLELAVDPKASYFNHRREMVYESSVIKFERLRNFLILPLYLEQLLIFGAAACMDAWLYVFTILPLRFFNALSILGRWWLMNAWKECADVLEFVYLGIGRYWRRKRSGAETPLSQPHSREPSRPRKSSLSNGSAKRSQESTSVITAWPTTPQAYRDRSNTTHGHRRTRSTPSLLQSSHKADLLKGALVIITSILLMQLDPSRIYHNVRGQSAVKLYVIYNALEVGDKLLSSLGQDVLECLFSQEILERNSDGRSKIIQPLWMFVLALLYTVIHSAALLYQTISLNVAVNSYSNALLTLLVSNQFVEIKGAVFKKIEKDNLFQLSCADVVERFQLWIMLLIIAMRNMVEVGGLNISLSSSFDSSSPSNAGNSTSVPFNSSSSIASNFLPYSLSILTGPVVAPFLFVLGSEMLVDWVKHAYVSKFNDVRPIIYARFTDVLTADYYSNAFTDQNLTRRVGLPVLPLACLFIRASIQTYNMLLATHLPLPIPSPATSLVTGHTHDHEPTSTPGMGAAIAHVDLLFRRALGRTGFQGDSASSASAFFSSSSGAFPTGWLLNTAALASLIDWLYSAFLLCIFLATAYLTLLATKLVLGLLLLSYSRARCATVAQRDQMAQQGGAAAAAAGSGGANGGTRQHDSSLLGSKRLGVNGMVEVGDEARRRIWEGDEKGLEKMKEKQERARRAREKEGREKEKEFDRVMRYDMVAKRIW